jgi:glycosyltransferase involved in cell wall biosynthesis
MDIALIAEGTYPHHAGGVSVWCDQLIRGLPEHRFHVHALSATGLESVTWSAPPNLASLSVTALWGRPLGIRPAGRTPARFDLAHADFLRAIVRPEGAGAAFASALRVMFEYAQTADLAAALLSNGALDRLIAVWQEARTQPFPGTLERDIAFEPTLADAVTASDLIAHFLQPLQDPPPCVDLCHSVSNGLSALVALASRWTYGTPFILTEHGVYLRERYISYLDSPYSRPVRMLVLNFFRQLSNTAYRTADLVTPGSEYNRRWEVRNGAASARIRPVYNGVNTAEFPVSDREPLVPTISWLGRIDPLKDIHTLIRAFALVREALPQAELRLFGPTPAGNENYRDTCLSLIRSLGLDGIARLEGRVRAPVDAYHAGHVVALTSISEGFPYSLIEAMASGRPVVATEVGGVPEAVGDAGVVVRPRDHWAVAEACVALLEDETLRRHLGAAARNRALAYFALDRFLDVYRHIYPEVASGARGHQFNPTLMDFGQGSVA